MAEIRSVKGVSKTGLVNMLEKLNTLGMLSSAMLGNQSKSTIRTEFQKATEFSGKYLTPYGRVVQQMELQVAELRYWEFIHPMAYLHLLCKMSREMFQLMATCSSYKVVMYVDEINPGNPLHPAPKRKLQGIYWALTSWPKWLLQRKDAWPLFSMIRSTVCEKLPGYMSGLMKKVLHVFFSPTGHNFLRGCVIENGGDSHFFTASFGAFLTDEKALKEVFDIKGQAGMFPCFSCRNLAYKRWRGAAISIVTLTCTDMTKVQPRTKAIITEMKKRILEAPKTERKELQKKFGINYNPDGLLWDAYLWDKVLVGTQNYCRDPMHTVSSNGVAGTEIALCIQALITVKISLEIVQKFGKLWVLPKAHGKVSDMYFQEELTGTDHVRHFASDVLGMVHLLYAFLIEKVRPTGVILEHIECFTKLFEIITLLRRGIRGVEKLRQAIQEHADLFIKIYGEDVIKPKFHQLLHIADDMLFLGEMISCFVTERKHKDLRECSKGVFNEIEHTVVHEFLNKTVQNYMSQSNNFLPQYLVNPKSTIVAGTDCCWAKSATLECGTIYQLDIVFLHDRSIAEVMEFWQFGSESVIVRLCRFQRTEDECLWKRGAVALCCKADEIVEALPYYSPFIGYIRIAPFPPSLLRD